MRAKQFIKAGTYHAAAGQRCQDALLLAEDRRFAAAVIADGASSCQCAEEGARLACDAVWNFMQQEGARLFSYSREELAYLLLEHVSAHIGQAGDRPLREYGSTLAAVCADRETGEAVFIGLGDSAVLCLQGQYLQMKVRPKRYGGQPCLTTTENAYMAVSVRRETLEPDETLLLCTDGFLNALRHDAGGIREHLMAEDYDALARTLETADEIDDCSYLAVTGMRAA